MSLIYHITSGSAVQAARQSGEYRPASLSGDGFIHFSQRHQVLDVANAFYRGQTDLALLVVDPARLQAELKYEAPIHPSTSARAPEAHDRFPHLYGPLNFEAVIAVVDFPPTPDGSFSLPAALD